MSTLSWVVVADEADPARAAWLEAARALAKRAEARSEADSEAPSDTLSELRSEARSEARFEARSEALSEAPSATVPEPRFVTWQSVLADEADFRPSEVVFCERLEGWEASNPVGGQRAGYRNFATALDHLSTAVEKNGAVLAAAAAPMLLTLDRVGLDKFLRQNDIPMLDSSDLDNAGRNIIRPRFAASDDWIIDGWYTTLYLHRARTGLEVWRRPAETSASVEEIKRVAGLLAEDGIHVTQELHRAHLTNSFHDIRFGLVDGKVTHTAGVVRERTTGPRKWYGGRRREIDDFFHRFGESRWERLIALAERTAALFPDIRMLGVDLILDNAAAEYVFDVNPFGADLPGRLGEAGTVGEGVPVKAAVLRALSAPS